MAKEIILGVCSTGSRLKLAVFDGKKIYCAQRRVFNQEKPLFPMIAKLLKAAGSIALAEAGRGLPLRHVGNPMPAQVPYKEPMAFKRPPVVSLRDVKTFCAVRGPGRFTGIRIGLTLGRVLEALAGAKIYSATLFEIMALQAFESPAFKNWSENRRKPKIAALMRAFKDEYFCQVFQVTGHASRKSQVSSHKAEGQGTNRQSQVTSSQALSLQPSDAPQWLKAAEMKDYLSALGPELFIIGDAEEDPSVYALAPADCAKAAPGVSKIIPAYLIRTAMSLKNGDTVPLYLKPARYELETGKRKANSK